MLPKKSYVTFACNYFAYKFTGFKFQRAVAKRSNLSVQRHFILKALYYLQVIGFVYIPSCYPWFMVKYKNTCTQPFVSGKSFDTPCKDFLSPWSICFSIMQGLKPRFGRHRNVMVIEACDRGMLRHTHVCVIVLLWIK